MEQCECTKSMVHTPPTSEDNATKTRPQPPVFKPVPEPESNPKPNKDGEMGPGEKSPLLPVVFFSKGSYFYDRPNSQLLATEPVLFINLNICGRFCGRIGEFGRNRP
jgi:hypothetical protein